MQGDPEVIEFLNEQLTAELTAINQYFLHAKMQENFGWVKLAKYTRAESFDEMPTGSSSSTACPTTSGCSMCGSGRRSPRCSGRTG